MNITGLDEAIKRAAMKALETGVREGATYMCDKLRAVVSGPGAAPHVTRGYREPHIYKRNGPGWTTRPKKWVGAARNIDGPPGFVTGKGRDTIGYKIIERNFEEGYIKLLIGVTGDAPGGMTRIPSYLVGWDTGIRVKGPGDSYRDNKAPRTGPVIQKPWLQTTVAANMGSFAGIVSGHMGGV